MRRLDRIIGVIGVLLILGGFIFGKISYFRQKSTPIQSGPTPTAVSQTTIPSVSATNSAVLGNTDRQEVSVIRVVDGDTIQVAINGAKEAVRLIGIDTPETVDPRKSVQCFGKEASNFTKTLVEGKTVFLQDDKTQGDRDKYKRLLRYVFLDHGTNANKLIIEEGYAHEYTYNTPYIYQAEFKEAEKEARENMRGLWATCPLK